MKLSELPRPEELCERSHLAILAAKALQLWHNAEADAVEAKRVADVAAEAAATALEEAREAFAVFFAPFSCDVPQPMLVSPTGQAVTTVGGAPLDTGTGLPEATPVTPGARTFSAPLPDPPACLLPMTLLGAQVRNGAGR